MTFQVVRMCSGAFELILKCHRDPENAALLMQYKNEVLKLKEALSCCVCNQLLSVDSLLMTLKCSHFICLDSLLPSEYLGCRGKPRPPAKSCTLCEDYSRYIDGRVLIIPLWDFQNTCRRFLSTKIYGAIEGASMEGEFPTPEIKELVDIAKEVAFTEMDQGYAPYEEEFVQDLQKELRKVNGVLPLALELELAQRGRQPEEGVASYDID